MNRESDENFHIIYTYYLFKNLQLNSTYTIYVEEKRLLVSYIITIIKTFYKIRKQLFLSLLKEKCVLKCTGNDFLIFFTVT